MKFKKYISVSLLSLLVLSNTNLSFANTNEIKQERLIGNLRYQTAVEVSKYGWFKSDNAVIVSGFDLMSSLCSTPLANLKQAPVLLTEQNKLTDDTKTELIRLGVKNVYLVESGNQLSAKVQSDLKALGINVNYIKGNDIYDMSLKVANEINKIAPVSKVAIVNGENGIADATSISGPAAQHNMPIILTSQSKGINYAKNFINQNTITERYIIGGETVLPDSIFSGIKDTKRLSGARRDDTNAKVIEAFYPNKSLDKVFVVKNGIQNSSHLVDAISLGSLAAKYKSPIVLTNGSLNNEQQNYLNTRNINEVVQVGGGANTSTFNQIVSLKGGNLNNLTKNISLIQARNILLNRFNGGKILYISYDQYDNEYDAKVIYNNNVYEVEISGYDGRINDLDIDDDYYDYNNIIGSNNIALINDSKVREIISAKFPGATILQLKYDREDNEYEADIKYNNKYYEVTISAFNGEVTDFDIDDDYKYQNGSNQNNPSSISNEKVKSIILSRFPGASILKLEYDREDNEYEADIKYKNRYYELTINASNGQITDVDLDD